MSKKKPSRLGVLPHIELDARLTILQAAALHRTLVARLVDGRPITVDGARVEQIDTAILQLLASLWRSSEDRRIACTWHGASDVLRSTAKLLGLAQILRFPEPASTAGGGAASSFS